MRAELRTDHGARHIRRHANRQVQRLSLHACLLTCILAASLALALLAGCGNGLSEEGGSPSATPPSGAASPVSAVPEPAAVYGRGETVPKGAVRTIMRYFAAVTARDAEAARALLTPDCGWRDKPLLDFRAVTAVRIDERLPYPPPKGQSVEARVTAHVDAVDPSGWGPPGDWPFYVTLREAPAGNWLIADLSTGR